MKHFLKGFFVTAAAIIFLILIAVSLKLMPALGLVYLIIVLGGFFGFINYKLNKEENKDDL